MVDCEAERDSRPLRVVLGDADVHRRHAHFRQLARHKRGLEAHDGALEDARLVVYEKRVGLVRILTDVAREFVDGLNDFLVFPLASDGTANPLVEQTRFSGDCDGLVEEVLEELHRRRNRLRADLRLGGVARRNRVVRNPLHRLVNLVLVLAIDADAEFLEETDGHVLLVADALVHVKGLHLTRKHPKVNLAELSHDSISFTLPCLALALD